MSKLEPAPASAPSPEELQRLHEQRLAILESGLEEAKRFIHVNQEQIKLIRQVIGLPPDSRQEAQPT